MVVNCAPGEPFEPEQTRSNASSNEKNNAREHKRAGIAKTSARDCAAPDNGLDYLFA